ncbi:hypothetical protein [Nocardioides dilutus]
MTQPSRRLAIPFSALALAVVLSAAGGAATGAALVTGAQIKDGSVTGKDIKNRSLKVKDLSKASVNRLRGQDGQDGADGASAFAPPPTGTVLTGGGIAAGYVDSENDTVYSYSPLPVTLSVELDDDAPGRTLFGGPHVDFTGSEESASRCAGTAITPTATPGTLCVYIATSGNTIPGSTKLKAGSAFLDDGAEASGFTVSALSDAAGLATVRYVWVYTAP